MRLYQWNIGNSFWLCMAQGAGHARVLLFAHLKQHMRQIPVKDASEIARALTGPPSAVIDAEEPVVLSVSVSVARG